MRKNLYYYVATGKSYYGKSTTDVLTAQILLDKARHFMPKADWKIVAVMA